MVIRVVRVLAGSAALVFLNYCAFRLQFNLSAATSINFLAVVLTALRFGFLEATGSSVVALTCLDYFFTAPVLTLQVADPQNLLALASFEFTALVVSRLSIRVQSHMTEAVVHQHNAEKLYEFSRSVLFLNRHEPPGPQIAALIVKNIDVDAVVIFDAEFARLDSLGICSREDEDLAKSAFLCDTSRTEWDSQRWVRVLRVGTKPIGAVLLHGGTLTPIMADAVTSLVATALERTRSFEKEARAEAIRQGEQLRKTVLDGLAHAFKTPLTVIQAGTSGLLEMKSLCPEQAELVELINEQSTELNELTNRFLRMAKLESAELHLQREPVAVPQLIDEVVGDCSDELYGHSVQVRVLDDKLAVTADRQLLAMTMTELLVNAAKYSTINSPIAVSAERRDDQIVLAVHNDGPEIALEEQELIFERFYRSPNLKHRAPGSGIGLAIAKKTAVAHRGNVWVSSERETGTTFFLSLPAYIGREHESLAN